MTNERRREFKEITGNDLVTARNVWVGSVSTCDDGSALTFNPTTYGYDAAPQGGSSFTYIGIRFEDLTGFGSTTVQLTYDDATDLVRTLSKLLATAMSD